MFRQSREWLEGYPMLRAGYRDVWSDSSHRTYAVPNRSGRWDKGWRRVKAALIRITRDRWVGYEEVHTIVHRLAGCASPGGWSQTSRAVLRGWANGSGILRGEPVAWEWEPGYQQLIGKLQGVKKPLQAELIILNFILKGK